MPAQRGFSLIEILVALTITALVVLGFSAATMTVVRSNEASANYTIATALAQDVVERLKAGALALADGNGCNPPTSGFTCSWDVTADTPQVGVTQADVTISWTDYSSKTVTITTVINN